MDVGFKASFRANQRNYSIVHTLQVTRGSSASQHAWRDSRGMVGWPGLVGKKMQA